MGLAFRHLFDIVSFESGIGFRNIVGCVNESTSEHSAEIFSIGQDPIKELS